MEIQLMSYRLSHIKLDIGGPKGNAFVVIALTSDLVKQIEGFEAVKKYTAECRGEMVTKLGGSWDYNDLLRFVVKKTGITLVAEHELPSVDSDLYVIEKKDEIYL